jgi:hypothetical protein
VERKRRKERREAVYFFQYTRHGKRRGIVEKRHTKEGTSIQELKHNRTKRQKMTRDSPPCDSLAIVTTGIEGVESRSDKLQTSEELNPHLTGSMGIENKRGRRMESALL